MYGTYPYSDVPYTNTPDGSNFPPTVALNTPADAATITDTTPTLAFTGTDANAEDIEYNVQISTSNTFGFSALNQTSRDWYDISVDSSNQNVYAATYSGDIYMQTAGAGDFIALGQTSRNWYGISVDSSNQNVYATDAGGDIYKQTAGAGDFVALSQTSRDWFAISVDSSNQNVYAATYSGDIYMQTAGSGNFTALGQTTRTWTGVAVDSSNQDVYATVAGGDIYKQTAGSGNFTALGQATLEWGGVSVDSSSHDVYAFEVDTGGIYVRTAGTGDFVVFLDADVLGTQGVSIDSSNHVVYVCTYLGDIYKQPLLSKFSTDDSGFVDITDGADTHPFASGDQIGYTVQAADVLATGTTYYWRAAAIDPSGSNTYGAWSATRSFTTNAAPTVALNTPADTATITDTTPTLAFTGTDANADDIEYNVQISDAHFLALGQTTRVWRGISVDSSNQNVYAVVNNGDIYMQTAGSGNFVALSQTSRDWFAISVDSSNQNVYATVYGGDIYMQTAGAGDFIALSQTSRDWFGISVDSSNQNVYAATYSGDLYKQTAGAGDFIALSQTSREWYGISVDSSNQNVYAVVNNGDIYMQTAGSGNFVALSQTSRNWDSISVDSSNQNVYATVYAGDIYKQTAGAGDFIALSQTSRNWTGISVDSSNQNVYAAANDGDIYLQAVIFDKFSATDTGFADITNGADTHPFASGDQVAYTVQAVDQMTNGVYCWRVAAIDPSGNNVYGAWSSTRTFTINNLAPTVALNTPADAAAVADTTPALAFTGTDAEADEIEYNLQIAAGGTYTGTMVSVASLTTINYLYGGTATSGQSSQSNGQSFTANGQPISRISLGLARVGTPVDNLVLTIRDGLGGNILATATTVAMSAVVDWGWTDFDFAIPYPTVSGSVYYLQLNRSPDTYDAVDYIYVCMDSGNSYTGGGWTYRNDNVWGIELATYDLQVMIYSPTTLDKFSSTDAGFIDVTNGADTHPFASGDQIGYTVQSADTLAGGTYYWQVIATDPSGSNTYGAWSAIRSFTVTAGGIKVWNGSAWVIKPIKAWNGSAWVAKPVKVWNGSAWVIKG